MLDIPVSFLDLPPEVRNLCYGFLFHATPQGSDRTPWLESLPTGFAYKFDCSILLVNRKIYLEASRILYGFNCFVIDIHWSPSRTNWYKTRPCQDTLNQRLLTAFKGHRSRRFVKDFVLKVPFTLHYKTSTDMNAEPSLMVEDQVAGFLNQVLTVMSEGPLIRSLQIFIRPILPRKQSMKALAKTLSVSEAFAPLLGRVHKHEIFEPRSFILSEVSVLRHHLKVPPIKRASFLGLPNKIRHICYSYIPIYQVSDQQPTLEPITLKNPDCWKSAAWQLPIALFQTCHQVHLEASEYFYSNYSLPVIIPQHLSRKSLSNIPHNYRRQIQHYNISWKITDIIAVEKIGLDAEIWQQLSQGPRIKTFRVRGLTTMPRSFLHFMSKSESFALLANHIDEVIVEPLTSHVPVFRPDSKLLPVLYRTGRLEYVADRDWYLWLRGAVNGAAKWTFPNPDFRF